MDKEKIIINYMPEDEMTRWGWISAMEDFLKQVLKNPVTAKVNDCLLSHGIDSPKALSLLLKRANPSDENSAILIRIERIKPEELSDEDIAKGIKPKDKFHIKYKLPRKDYMKKMRNLYISLYENHVVDNKNLNEDINYYERPLSSTPNIFKNSEKVISQCPVGSTGDRWAKYVNNNEKKYKPHMMIDEDGEAMGGATSCDASSGQFIQPLAKKPIKRTIYLTQEQYDYLKEAVEMDTAFGDFGYDAPGLEKKQDPAYDHKNMMKKSWRGRYGKK